MIRLRDYTNPDDRWFIVNRNGELHRAYWNDRRYEFECGIFATTIQLFNLESQGADPIKGIGSFSKMCEICFV